MSHERFDVDVGSWDPRDMDPRHGDDSDLDRPSSWELYEWEAELRRREEMGDVPIGPGEYEGWAA